MRSNYTIHLDGIKNLGLHERFYFSRNYYVYRASTGDSIKLKKLFQNW